MMSYEDVLKNFKRNTENHTAEIRLNNGLYRHIRFSRNGSSAYHFNLVTFPGYLTIAGDCGTFTFSRVSDMFEFFRMDSNDFNKRPDGELSINPHYWQEKLQAGSCDGKAISEEWCSEKYEKVVREYLEGFISGCDDAELIEEITSQVNEDLIDMVSHEYEAYDAISNFDSEHLSFDDFWEHDFTDYKYHYIWCLYAIVWGIQEYDRTTSQEAKAA